MIAKYMYTNVNYIDKHELFKILFSLQKIRCHSAVDFSVAVTLSESALWFVIPDDGHAGRSILC